MQLVGVIQAGVDVDPVGSPGYGSPDLDASHISYAGVSMGTWYGGPFLGVEPDVGAGVLNALGGPEIERRLGANRAGASQVLTAATMLATRTPSFLNSPGITALDGLNVSTPYFNENMPLRDGVPLPVTVLLPDETTETRVIQSPVTNDVDGAMAIQKLFDNWEWVSQPGNPIAYAPHLRKRRSRASPPSRSSSSSPRATRSL